MKEIKNQLVNNYNISLDEFALYSKYEDLSENCDDKLLDTIYGTYENKEFYLYNKKEFYEINIEYSFESSLLKIHDAMKIKNIINIFKNKYNLSQHHLIFYYLIVDGIKLNEEKEAAFYNFRAAKSIILKEVYLDG